MESPALGVLVEASASGAIAMDPAGRIIMANPAARAILSATAPDGLIGRVMPDLIEPQDRPQLTEWLAASPAADQSGLFTVRYDAAGETRWLGMLVSWVAAGHQWTAVATFADATDRMRQREELQDRSRLYQSVFDYGLDGIGIVDTDGRMVQANESLARMHGYPRDELVGMTVFDLMFAEDVDDIRQRFDRRASGEAPGVYSVENRYRQKDGTAVWLRIAVTPLELSGQRMFLAMVHDVTQRRSYETRLEQQQHSLEEKVTELEVNQDALERQSRELRALATALESEKHRAEEANEAKSRFLANMSHELRTPLNAILGFSEIMKGELIGDLGSSAYRDYAGNIHESGAHLLALINDVLDMSKVEANRYVLNETEFDLAEVTDAALRQLRPQAERDQIMLEMAVPVGVRLWADERVVRQMVLNLLTNAVKFTPPGGNVVLSVEGVDDRLSLCVRDNGIGIPPGEIDRVTRPFEQVVHDGRAPRAGTGLGLALTKSLIELHGGALRLDSRVGEGTTARLDFPPARLRAQAPLAQGRAI
ncbi:MAG: PAS domain S-box protein [Alphaproteobacteria bacterium]